MAQSNEPTIESKNEVIARFMGMIRYEADDKRGRTKLGAPYFLNEKGRFIGYIHSLEYHTSWEWLMPVVEKIETVEVNDGRVFRIAADVKIFYQACIIEYIPDEESGDPCEDEITIQTQGETKLEAVYKAVYQFITWYNQQTTTNGNENV